MSENTQSASVMPDRAGRDAIGWRAVIGCAIAIFFTGTMVFGYSGVVMGEWTERFGSSASLAMTFLLLAIGITFFLAGKWHNYLGTRKAFVLGILCEVVAILLLQFWDSVYACYCFCALTGTNSAFVLTPGLATVQNWFPNKRGFVTGIVNLIFGGAASIMSLVMNAMLNSMGYYKMNWVLMVLIVVVTGIGAVLAEMPQRTKMTDAQQLAHDQLLAEMKSNKKGGGLGQEYSTMGALKTKAFWMLWICWLTMGTAGISMVTISKMYPLSLGIAGVGMLTAYNVTNGVSRIIAGPLSDKINRRTVGTIGFTIAALGYAGLLFLGTSPVVMYILAAFVGYGFGTIFAISGAIVTDLFGLKNFGTIFGLVFTAYGLIGGILGPILMKKVLEVTGNNYTPVFTYLCVFCIIAAVFIQFVKHGPNQEVK